MDQLQSVHEDGASVEPNDALLLSQLGYMYEQLARKVHTSSLYCVIRWFDVAGDYCESGVRMAQ
jgi:hypothetical protein